MKKIYKIIFYVILILIGVWIYFFSGWEQNLLDLIFLNIIVYFIRSVLVNISDNLIKNRIARFIFGLIVNIVWLFFIFMLLIAIAPDFAISIISFLIVAVSLTFRNLINNVASGMMIIASEQIGVGDLVEISGIQGIVDEITLNYTKLRELDGIFAYIPNQNIYGSTVKKFTYKISKKSISFEEGRTRAVIKLMTDAITISGKEKFTKYVKSVEILQSIDPENLKRLISPVFDKYEQIFGARPDVVIDTTGIRCVITLYIVVKEPIFILQYTDAFLRDLVIALYPNEVFNGWDSYKADQTKSELKMEEV